MSNIKVSMGRDGIAIVEPPEHAVLTLQDIQDEYKERVKITSAKVPVLVKFKGVASFSDEAQDFLCSEEYQKITAAVAVLTDAKAGYYEHSKLLVDLFRDLKKPPFDIQRFEALEPAMAWLKSYI